MSTIAILYVSRTGTTREIAERLQVALEAAGHEIRLYDIENDRPRIDEDASSWDRIILGSPIHGMRPAAALSDFVQGGPSLGDRVAGLFFTSMVYPTGRGIWRRAIESGARRLAEQLGADRFTIFGGRSEDPLPGFVRWLFGTDPGMPLDQRDWDAIDGWGSYFAA